MTTKDMRREVSLVYKTIKGTPVANISDQQIMAIFFRLRKSGQIKI